MLDGRLYRVEKRRGWDRFKALNFTPDLASEVEGADEREVEEVLKPFAGMRLYEVNRKRLRPVENELNALKPSGSRARKRLGHLHRELGGIDRVKQPWGVIPYATWKHRSGLPSTPEIRLHSTWRSELTYVDHAMGEGIRDIFLNADLGPGSGNATIDLGALEMRDGNLVPLLVRVSSRRRV